MATQVLGYDGTDGARAALDAAVGAGGGAGRRRSLSSSPMHTGRLGGEVRDYDEALREHGRGVLEEARSIAREAGVEIELVLRELSPAEALIAVADEHDARMIVVGSYGERPLKSALVGSTPTRLLHLSERPVLVVRAPE